MKIAMTEKITLLHIPTKKWTAKRKAFTTNGGTSYYAVAAIIIRLTLYRNHRNSMVSAFETEEFVGHFFHFHRSLEDVGSDLPTAAPTNSAVVVESNDAEIIRGTLRVYGSFYLLFFIAFCYLRKRFPKYYNIRSWVPEMECELAKTIEYPGYFSWAWRVMYINDTELLHNIGMDGLCFIRCLRLGAKLSFSGVLNSIWLIPMFLTAEESEDVTVEDKFAQISVAHLPSGSPRFAGVVVAAYVTLFYALHLLSKELDWYSSFRHKYLSQRLPQNYAIYVTGIPEELRSDFALGDYFRSWTREGAVVETHMAMQIPSLDAEVAKRQLVVQKLEHAIAQEKILGTRAQHRKIKLNNLVKRHSISQKVDSIEAWEVELKKLNNSIATRVGNITNKNDRMRQFLKKTSTSSRTTRKFLLTHNLSPLANLEEESAFDPEESLHQESIENLFGGESELEGNSEEKMSKNQFRTRNETESSICDTDAFSEKAGLVHTNGEPPHPFLQLVGMSQLLGDETQPSTQSYNATRTDASNTKQARDLENGGGAFKDGLDRSLEGGVPGASEADSHAFPAPEGLHGETKHGKATASLTVMTTGESVKDSTNQVDERDVEDPDELKESNRNDSGISSSSTTGKASGKSARQSIIDLSKKVRNSNAVSGAAKATGKGMNSAKRVAGQGVNSAKKAADMGISGAKRAAELGLAKLQDAPELASSLKETAAFIVPALASKEDGTARNAGFITFRTLFATQAARQMLQHGSEVNMIVEPAPPPKEVFWRNVGLPDKARKTGSLLSTAATTALCFFWSIPVAFLSSLTEVNSLKEKLPTLAKWVEAAPWLESFLAVLAPLLLLILNEGVLPNVLKWFSTWEGLVGAPQLEAATFVKLSSFVIIQTFFVSAVSGSVTSELAIILDNPEELLTLLGNSLATQSSYFIQIVLVFTFMVQGVALLRLQPIAISFVRKFVGPNLTASERRKSWRFARSLEDPPDFFHAEVFAQIILFFVIFFVYAPIAPVTCIFLWMAFLICESGYRYHFIHNYKTTPDSGGRIFKGFTRVFLVSIFIGQLTLLGTLGLKQAVYALPALAPLLIITVLYTALVYPKKIQVADSLPTIVCVELDKERDAQGITPDEWKSMYLQPSLKDKYQHPDRNVGSDS